MSLKPTILMLLLATLGAAAMVYDIRHAPGRDSDRAAHGPQRLGAMLGLPVEDVSRITLQRNGQPAMVFERRSMTWMQVEPFEHPMDPFSIRQFAVLAHDLEIYDRLPIDSLTSGQSLATLSLEPAEAMLTFEWPGGSARMRLGRRSVAGRAFMQMEDAQEILIVENKLHDRAVDMEPKEWRDRTIFQNASVESQRVEYEYSGNRMVIERDRKRWMMLEPVVTRVDPVGRDAYFADLARAQVSGFILDQPTDLAKFGLAPPAATLTIVNAAPPAAPPDGSADPAANARTQRLLIGARIGGSSQDRFAMVEGRPVVCRLSGAAVVALLRQPVHLIDPTGCAVEPADVKSLVIRSGRGAFKLERDLERWLAPDHGNVEVEPAFVQQLLEQLTQTRAPAVKVVPYPHELEVATVTLYGYNERALDTVRIVKAADTGEWGLENGDNVLRVFPASMQLRLTPANFGLDE